MAWLVELNLIEASDRLANFLGHLDDARAERGLDAVRIAREPTALASVIVRVEHEEDTRQVIQSWEEWVGIYHPEVRLSEPVVTLLQENTLSPTTVEEVADGSPFDR